MDKKSIIIIVSSIIAIAGIFGVVKFGLYTYEKEKEEEIIREAVVEVELAEDLIAPFNSKKRVSDFITSINGEIVDDYLIDTIELGNKNVSFEFVNDDGIKVPYSYVVEVKDTTPPIVWLSGNYYIDTKFSSTLEEKILCADDYDDVPTCRVEGTYDTKKIGKYQLNFKATDSSGNETSIPFTLHVSAPSTSSSSYNPTRLPFSEMVTKFKNDNTALGIDVSSWQGNLNFEKLKKAGVEFAFIRVGSKWASTGEYFLDSKFERNMEGFNEVGIPVGAYFYSYAKNEEEAKEEAEWVIEKLKSYKVDLPVAFDFEDWGSYNKYEMSLYRLNRNAEVFIQTLKDAGYEGMLYGSLNYLNKMWDTDEKIVWGAHYTTNANYEGTFDYWQFSSAGRVDGCAGDVDLNIMYK